MLTTTSRLAIAAAALAAAAVISACGSSSHNSPGSPSSSGSRVRLTYAQAQQDAVNFAACVRSHGVPNFPDPASPREFKESLGPSSPEARSPAFQAAATACHNLLPSGPPSPSAPHTQAQIAAMVAFAGCMRSHGFPSFPDPTSTGSVTHEMLAEAGIDVHQPAAVRTADGCVSVTHGILTKTDVARFVAGR